MQTSPRTLTPMILALLAGPALEARAPDSQVRGELQSVLADLERAAALRQQDQTSTALQMTDEAARRLNVISFGVFNNYTTIWSGLLLGQQSVDALSACFDEVMLLGAVAQKTVEYEQALGNGLYATIAQYLIDYWFSTYQTDLQQKKQLVGLASLVQDKERLLAAVDQQLETLQAVKTLSPAALEAQRQRLFEQLRAGG
jgi:hypothetical protein